MIKCGGPLYTVDMMSHRMGSSLLNVMHVLWVKRHEVYKVSCQPSLGLIQSVISLEQGDTFLMQSFVLVMSQLIFLVALVLSQKVLAYTKGLGINCRNAMLMLFYVESVKRSCSNKTG